MKGKAKVGQVGRKADSWAEERGEKMLRKAGEGKLPRRWRRSAERGRQLVEEGKILLEEGKRRGEKGKRKGKDEGSEKET